MDTLKYIKSWLSRQIWLGLTSDKVVLKKIEQEIEESRSAFDNPIAYARINERGDLFDLRLQANPFITNLVPLYLRPDYAIQRQQAMQSQSQKP